MNGGDLEFDKKAIEALLDFTFEKTVESIQSVASKARNQFLIKTKKALKKYLETAIKKYNEIKTIFNSAEPILLDSFYVDLDLLIGRKLLTGNITKILKYGKPLIITGLAGSGKSTLLKFLFLQTIKSKIKIPFFIELKNIKNLEISFTENILSLFNEMNLGLPLDDFLILLEQGEYILFFDGLDEVSPALFNYVEQGIINLRDKYYKSLCIVTSRPNDIFQSWHNFSEASVQPLSKDKAVLLLSKINYETEIKERFIKDVKASLFDKHKSFLSNPLLLSIMLITYGQYADIPDKLTLFYQQAFEALFNKHDATKQGLKRTRHTTIPIDDFQKIISALSIQSYLEHKINFNKQEVINYLSLSKKIINVQNYDEELVLNDLLQSLCIIVRDGLLYTFTHRSFQEYFSAIFISTCENNNRKKIINNIMKKSSTDNIFYLLFEIDRTIIEDDFLLDEINKINNTFSTNDNPELSFFISLFSYISFDNNDFFGFTIVNGDYFDVYYFFTNTYIQFYMKEFIEMRESVKKLASKLSKYQIKKTEGTVLEISIVEILNDQEYSSLFLEFIKPYLFIIKKIFELPEKVKNERKNKNDTLSDLLK
jgi:nucleoside-triphosphatase THEP1